MSRPDQLGHPQVVSVAMNTDGFPYSFRDEDGQLKGFAVDLSRAIARVMNFRIQEMPGDAAATTNLFLDGKVDVIQIFSRSPERLSLADFSNPYLRMVGAIIVRKDDTRIHVAADLKGRKVLVHPKSVGEAYLINHGLRDSIVLVGSVPEALKLLNAGEGDAVLATRLTAMSLAKHHGLRNLEPRGPSLEGFYADYCYAVKPGNKALLAAINEGLGVLQMTGEYDQIYDTWFGAVEKKGYSKTQILGALLIGLGVAFIVAVISSIRRKRLLVELGVREELYRGVFESAHEALLVLEPRGGDVDYLVLQQANPAAFRYLGLPSPLPEKATLRSLLLDDLALSDRISAGLREGGVRVFEYQRAEAAEHRHLVVSIAQIGRRVLLVITDFTEIKAANELLARSEQQLRQTQKLEAIGTLASGVAHDFNNILTGILGNAELAKMDLADGSDPMASIEQIQLSAERARQLVRQILTFSRKAEVRRELLDPSAITEEALRFVRAASPASITICHKKADTPVRIEADATQLHQVVMNLCTNAVHAMAGRNGVLELQEDCVDIDPSTSGLPVPLDSGRYLRLSVRDTGCGMGPEVLQRVFEPFFTTKAPGDGTGLGLSVVHGIVRKHGGAVTVYSQPGQGTVFHVYLPVAGDQASVPGSDSGAHQLVLGRGEQILLVDDEAVIVKAASLMLQRLGYQVTGYNRPAEALEAFRLSPERYDLLITDLTMPTMNGIDLASQLHLIRPGLPVLLMSGFVGELEVAQVSRHGFAGVLDKPLSLAFMSRKVREALDGILKPG